MAYLIPDFPMGMNGSRPDRLRLNMVLIETDRTFAASGSLSSRGGEAVPGMVGESATIHRAFQPFGECLQHCRQFKHEPPTGTDARQPPRVCFSPQPCRR